MDYEHLTNDEHHNIYLLKPQGMALTVSGLRLGQGQSTISRELRSNRGLRGY